LRSRHHAEQGREQRPVRPVHGRVARLPPVAGRRAGGAGSRSLRSSMSPHARTTADT
jgi:hypothetical protein